MALMRVKNIERPLVEPWLDYSEGLTLWHCGTIVVGEGAHGFAILIGIRSCKYFINLSTGSPFASKRVRLLRDDERLELWNSLNG